MRQGPLIHIKLVDGSGASGHYANRRIQDMSDQEARARPALHWPLSRPAFPWRICLDVSSPKFGTAVREFNAALVTMVCRDRSDNNWHKNTPQDADHLVRLRIANFEKEGAVRAVQIEGMLAHAWVNKRPNKRYPVGEAMFTNSIPVFYHREGGFQLVEFNPVWVLTVERA